MFGLMAVVIAGIVQPASAQIGFQFSSFIGPQFSGGFPADPAMAVSRETILVGVNGEIAAYDRTGTRIWRQTDAQFWDGVGDADFDSVFDPKILYDFGSQRFFIVWIATQGENNNMSWIMIGVSKTADPTDANDGDGGSWLKFAVPSTFNGSWSDYPSIGVDANAFYVTGNWFGVTSGQATGSHILVFEKSQFLSGTNPPNVPTYIANFNVTTSDNQSAFTISPVTSYDSDAQIEYFVSAQNGTNDKIYVYQINGGLAPTAIRKYALDVTQYTQPGQVFARDSGPMDSVDSRIFHAIRINDEIWCAHNIQDSVTSGTMCKWYRISIDSDFAVSLSDSGTVSNSNGSAWLGGICANQAGDAMLVHTRAGPTEYPSIYYSFRLSNDAPGQMQGPVLVKAGEAGYNLFRWGDYTTPALDPTDLSTIWGYHMYSNSIGWGTQILQVPLTLGDGGPTDGPPEPPCPTVTSVTRPVALENWVRGAQRDIKWTFSGTGEHEIDIALLKRNELVGMIASNVTVGDLSYTWDVGSQLENGVVPDEADDYRILVKPSFCADPAKVAKSNNFFTITEKVRANAAPPEAIISADSMATVEIARNESIKLGAVDVDGKSLVATRGKGPYTYRWSPADFLDDATLARPTAAPLFDQTYSVEVRDSTGSTDVDEVRIIIGDPLRVDAGPSKAFRTNGTVVLEGSAVGGTPPYFYEWSPIPDPTLEEGANGQTDSQPTARPDGPTVYTLRVTDARGVVGSDTVSVVPGIGLTIVNDPGNAGLVKRDIVQDLYMAGDEIALTAESKPGFVFSHWANPGAEFFNRPADPNVQFTENPTTIRMIANDVMIEAMYRQIQPTGAGQQVPGGICGAGTPALLGGMLVGLGLVSWMRRRRAK
jgi:hypothetical protein